MPFGADKIAVDELGRVITSLTGVFGSEVTCALVAKTTAPVNDDMLQSPAGFKALEVRLIGAVTAGTGDAFTEMVVVAWSTSAGDVTGVANTLAAALLEFDGTPTVPPVLLSNVALLRTVDDIATILWDGTTTIKTVGVRAAGATPSQVNVEVRGVV